MLSLSENNQAGVTGSFYSTSIYLNDSNKVVGH